MSHASAAPVLRELLAGTRPLTHEALDQSPASHAITFLRTALVRHGALPARDELSHRFEQWIHATTSRNLPDQPDRAALRRWATWIVLHDLRRQTRKPDAAIIDKSLRRLVLVSQHFIQWLHDRDLTLAMTHQEHVDRWLADGNSTSRYVKPFLAWAANAGLAPHLTIAENRPSEHRTSALEDNTRLRLLKRLIHDDTLEPRARVPALLILVYGQPLARVARMRTNQVTTNDDTTTIQLGRDHIVLPDPIDQLVRDSATQPRRRTLHDTPDSPWLFPGQKAGAPIAPEGLRRRLNKQFPNMPIRPGRSCGRGGLAVRRVRDASPCGR